MIVAALGTVITYGVAAFVVLATLMLVAIGTDDDDPWYQDGEFE